MVERTFGTEELSAYSTCLQELACTPGIFMQSTDAKQLNLADGDQVAVELQSGTITAQLQVAENMASGMLVIPRSPELGWQIMNTDPELVTKDQIRKLNNSAKTLE